MLVWTTEQATEITFSVEIAYTAEVEQRVSKCGTEVERLPVRLASDGTAGAQRSLYALYRILEREARHITER